MQLKKLILKQAISIWMMLLGLDAGKQIFPEFLPPDSFFESQIIRKFSSLFFSLNNPCYRIAFNFKFLPFFSFQLTTLHGREARVHMQLRSGIPVGTGQANMQSCREPWRHARLRVQPESHLLVGQHAAELAHICGAGNYFITEIQQMHGANAKN